MNLKRSKGLTLVENLVSLILLGIFVTSFLGAFFISRLSTLRVQHRMTAMNILKEYLERESEAGMDGGNADISESDKADYYVTVKSADPLTITPVETITIDGQTYNITPDPYFPNNVYADYAADSLLTYENRNYAIKGFVVTWTENNPGSGGVSCSERAAIYLFDHGTT